ncbi:acireductone dioxygenase [Pseudomonas sp. GD03842]|uniref:acireductone dioxygenase n=1 Tax=unclassified Pseudomonas TaxID=196821 RepID=UPI000D33B6B3|nr:MULTISPECIES: acireductone dioxygenase [unclassified Pseudomonas]MDH0745368.1 acireductone dioxygenase [Pseudomonas sp. GD03842]RAU41574.1 acireductone dioxygenase [Pseudomonas sp. RIT 409]RAU46841.1 acireductone dioxygenase [Pseudomonas sp. RIT 412]
MSILFVNHVASPGLPDKVLTHPEDIASTLREQGILFDRLALNATINTGASPEDVLDACRAQIDQLMTQQGHAGVEVILVDEATQRGSWRAEHQHSADDLRVVVAGRGLLSLRVGDFVYSVLCEKNDLIAVPAGTRRWLDLGDHPRFVAIRLFKDESGRQMVVTGDSIAEAFPGLDD